jgi:hypothetical protein
MAAMRTRCRGRVAGADVHGEAMAQARLGWGAANKGAGTAGSRGEGAHARARVLASQGRGVAVPCAGHRHLGPAARRGGGRRRRYRGKTAARRAPARKTARRPEG